MAATSAMSRVSTIASPLAPIGIGYTPWPSTTSLTVTSLSMKYAGRRMVAEKPIFSIMRSTPDLPAK